MNEICHGRQGITANIAVRLGKYFNVDPQWFMNMQAKYDLQLAEKELSDTLRKIAPVTKAA